VFKAKLTAFLSNIRKGSYFPSLHKVFYEMHVIEYQHRGIFIPFYFTLLININFSGLPHAQIIILFTNIPEYSDKQALSEWIDTHISAEFPVVNDMS